MSTNETSTTPTTPVNDTDTLVSNPAQETPPNEQQRLQRQESRHLKLHLQCLSFYLSDEEAERLYAAYAKDAEIVTNHRLPMDEWLRAIVLDWVSVVERHSDSAESSAPMPGEQE